MSQEKANLIKLIKEIDSMTTGIQLHEFRRDRMIGFDPNSKGYGFLNRALTLKWAKFNDIKSYDVMAICSEIDSTEAQAFN